jgi:hypothetical protein
MAYISFLFLYGFQMSLTEAGFVATFYLNHSLIVGILLAGGFRPMEPAQYKRPMLTQAVGLMGTTPFYSWWV